MSNEYIVVSDEVYAPEAIITTWDDLVEECEERGMDASSLHTEPLMDWLASGREAFNYAYVHPNGEFKSAAELAAE